MKKKLLTIFTVILMAYLLLGAGQNYNCELTIGGGIPPSGAILLYSVPNTILPLTIGLNKVGCQGSIQQITIRPEVACDIYKVPGTVSPFIVFQTLKLSLNICGAEVTYTIIK